jgi:hypothetical protein
VIPGSYLFAQNTDTSKYMTVVAGKQYGKGKFYQSLWGKHYRKEWTTATRFKIVMLDTLEGGLTPYEAGGSRQSKSIKLRDHNNREYVLRSIDKDFSGILPPVARGSFIESITRDQTSIGHPYSAVTIPAMAEAIGIYHTNPRSIIFPNKNHLENSMMSLEINFIYLNKGLMKTGPPHQISVMQQILRAQLKCLKKSMRTMTIKLTRLLF